MNLYYITVCIGVNNKLLVLVLVLIMVLTIVLVLIRWHLSPLICPKSIAFNLSNGTNQQEDQHSRCPEEDYVRR